MKLTDIRFLAAAAEGRLFGEDGIQVGSVCIDSRKAQAGSLFVCIKGESNDGHDFAPGAYESGCRAFLMTDPQKASDFLQTHTDTAIVLAQDARQALRAMAAAYIGQFSLKRIAVTGSVGKTTTKELTAAVMSAKYRTVRTQKNLNTDLGLALTCFLADETTEAVVFEMGMDRKGEIEEDCSWIRPECCIITNIGISHLEKLGSREAIADAKLEITKHMDPQDPLIYNCDSDFLGRADLDERTARNFVAVPVGTSEEAEIRITDVTDRGAEGISFELSRKRSSIRVDLPLLGVHNAGNAALAFACGLWYGISPAACAEALAGASGETGRLSAEDLGDVYLIDDSYNASPASMAAALGVLASVKAGRRVAVLADMYELGSAETEGHIKTGEKAAECGVDLLIAVGESAKYYVQGALSVSSKMSAVRFPSADAAAARISSLVMPGDAVLVKGSNSTGVGRVAEALRRACRGEE